MPKIFSLVVVLLSGIIIASQAKSINSNYEVAEGQEIPSRWQYFVLESMFQDPKVMSMVSKIVHDLEGNGVDSAERINRPTKRNSELLNSLLGLPKNILKSG